MNILTYLSKEMKYEPRGYGLLTPKTVEILSRRVKTLLLGIEYD